MSDASGEKRTFSRVQTRFKTYIRVVDEEHPLPRYNKQGGEVKQADQQGLRKANLPDALVDFLVGIDEKLDSLLSMRNQEMLSEDFPHEAEVHEISGAGIVFETEGVHFDEGQMLEVVMILNQFPLRMAGAVGTVERCEDCGDDAKRHVLHFSKIRDADLEAVVQFVFSEQRDQIRERKWN